jgi:amino acid adenylation domain-containing protein
MSAGSISAALAGPFVLDAFEAVARVQPVVPAVALEDGRVCSYGELDRLATHISRVVRLMMSRSPPSEAFDDGKINTPLVALMMNRDVAFIASMLGVLKAEAGYVPVDPTFPSDRQSYIFEQSKCMCLVIDTENYQAALDLGVTLPKNVVRVHSKTCKILDPVLREEDLPAPVPASSRVNDADSLAYILYTSGSTGRPKGVMVKNAGVMNQIDWFAADLQSGPHTRVLGLATFCFDISVLEIYLPLTRGGLLMLAVASTQKDPFRIAELIQEHKINFFQATPTTYDMLFAIGWAGDPNVDFLVGGEAFRPSLIKAVRNCHSFRNVYGPTETTVWASGFVVPKDFTAESLPPVGVPGLNYVFRIIDHERGPPWKEVGPGQEGELWIGGSNVGRGYLGRPDLSREVYLPDMFAGHGLIYRTGDLVKQLPDGNYYYLQRIDNQVKIDGFRIELQEIENVYLGNDKIEQCVVLLRGKRLVLYVKPAPQFSPLSPAMLTDIHAEASKKLMYYMMPKATVIVDKFALTATGKIDRKPLPDPPEQLGQDTPPEGANGNGTRASSAALSIASTASRVLRMEDVIIRAIENMRGKRPPATSNFGSIGVDSLGAVMFIKYLSDLFGGVRISPKELYSPGVTIRTFSLR